MACQFVCRPRDEKHLLYNTITPPTHKWMRRVCSF